MIMNDNSQEVREGEGQRGDAAGSEAVAGTARAGDKAHARAWRDVGNDRTPGGAPGLGPRRESVTGTARARRGAWHARA